MKPTLLAATALLGLTTTTNGGSASPEQLRECFRRSHTYEATQEYANAIKALAPVFRSSPQSYTLNLRLGWLYYLSGSHANAAQHYGQATKVAPGAIEAELGYLLPLLAQGRWEQAETVATKIIKVDYCNYYANLRLAYALRRQKKHDQAEKVANRMLVLYPTDVKLLTEMALTKLGQGDKASAAKLLSRVLLLDPENVAVTEVLGAD